MSPGQEQTPERNEPNTQEKGVANSDRTYWFAVNIAWVWRMGGCVPCSRFWQSPV
jgi:hypothetical protein